MCSFLFALINTLVKCAGDMLLIQKSFLGVIVAIIFDFIMIKKDHISIMLEKKNLIHNIMSANFGTTGIILSFTQLIICF